MTDQPTTTALRSVGPRRRASRSPRVHHLALTDRLLRAGVIAAVTAALAGCVATREVHYAMAHDPTTRVTNHFRILTTVRASSAKLKVSSGYYDRHAVEQLFGEQELAVQFEATQLRVFDAETGKRLKDLTEALATANRGIDQERVRRLARLRATAAELFGEVRAALATQEEEHARYAELMERVGKLIEDSGPDLDDPSNRVSVAKAEAAIREAVASLSALHLALNGSGVVVFYDGSGSRIDVRLKTHVLFVSSDVSPFVEAIRQLAESDGLQQQLIGIAMGPKLEAARRIAYTRAADDLRERAILDQFTTTTDRLAGLGAPTQADLHEAIAQTAKAMFPAIVGDVDEARLRALVAELEDR